MFSLPLSTRPDPSREPFSRQTLAKTSRLRGSAITESVCPYCAVGCGQLIYTKAGKAIDIEGEPRSPSNEGPLCPKGADAFQLAVIPHRATHVRPGNYSHAGTTAAEMVRAAEIMLSHRSARAWKQSYPVAQKPARLKAPRRGLTRPSPRFSSMHQRYTDQLRGLARPLR